MFSCKIDERVWPWQRDPAKKDATGNALKMIIYN